MGFWTKTQNVISARYYSETKLRKYSYYLHFK